MAELYRSERIPFVIEVLAARPWCEIQWSIKICTGKSVDVHEVISRSQGGQIVPNEKAEAQGQVFKATCRPCHTTVTNDATGEAAKRGLKYSRKLHGALPFTS